MNFSIISNLAELCAKKGIRHAVLCPGSRSAPLTLGFARNKSIRCWTFSDERSAAFTALGMASQTHKPVALVCTSGSAAYNFAPAVAEAFYQQIPLIVFTADRPAEWIDQYDGQTIRQKELYGQHVKGYFELPVDYTHPDAEWHAVRIINDAVNLSFNGQPGPVHINAPFREPLYPRAGEKTVRKSLRVIEPVPAASSIAEKDWVDLKRALGSARKVLVVSGQMDYDAALCRTLSDFHPWPLAGDILCNLHSLPFLIRHTDTFLGQIPAEAQEALRPDLLITFGKSLISKNLKLFLRKHQPAEHWHLQESGMVADTFQSLTKIIPVSPLVFFGKMKSLSPSRSQTWNTYQEAWQSAEAKTIKNIESFFKVKRPGEFQLVRDVLTGLPSRCNLHLSNSMSVRYANHIGLRPDQKNVVVMANRGTSGIDGCTSTAVGHALTSAVPNILITGDQAFFYDRNAFWHNYDLKNLLVVLLNNHGGIIFNLIDGPSGLPESSEFFITEQKLNARSLATEFGLAYVEGSKAKLNSFFKPGKKAKILEMESSQARNKKIFEDFKKSIRHDT